MSDFLREFVGPVIKAVVSEGKEALEDEGIDVMESLFLVLGQIRDGIDQQTEELREIKANLEFFRAQYDSPGEDAFKRAANPLAEEPRKDPNRGKAKRPR